MNRYELLLKILESKRTWRRFLTLVVLFIVAALVMLSQPGGLVHAWLSSASAAVCGWHGAPISPAVDRARSSPLLEGSG
ncbi:hypothetical protein [Amycolatopsis magusensis]|uniref:hypothetical protein n=1 Tax=Amycolatopsis magusensis TaxID=882444 RepID=UPI0037BC0180